MRIAKGLEPLLKRAALRTVRRRGNTMTPPVDRASLRRVMIYRPERFGDMLATLPVIRALKTALPSSHVDIWTSAQGRELLEPEPSVDHVAVIAGKASDRRHALASEPYDLVIDLQMRDSTNALLTCDAAARDGILAGWGKDKLRCYYDWAPALDDSDQYAMDRGLGVLDLLAATVPPQPDFMPAFTAAERHRADSLIGGDDKAVVLNLSAGGTDRQLDELVWTKLAGWLTEHTGSPILLNALGSDRQTAGRIAANCSGSVRILPDNLTFREAASVVSQASLFISPDTSLVHIAAGANVPTVALYVRRTDFRMSWMPPYDHVRAVESAEDTLAAITVDQIIHAVASLDRAAAGKAP